MIRLVPFLFILSTLHTFCQSETLEGMILADSLQGYAINIVNFTKEIGTTNDEKGFFKIPASQGDSIVFSSVQYETLSLIVETKNLGRENNKIRLTSKVQQLEKVKISNIELSGNLNSDSKNIEILPFVDNKILGLPFSDKPQPTLIERRIYTARSGILELPINYLNGKLKKLKRIKALEDLDKIVLKGEQTFDTAFFIEEAGIPEDLISDFMYYCAEDDYFKDLLVNTKRLSLLEFFKEKSIAYKAYKKI